MSSLLILIPVVIGFGVGWVLNKRRILGGFLIGIAIYIGIVAYLVLNPSALCDYPACNTDASIQIANIIVPIIFGLLIPVLSACGGWLASVVKRRITSKTDTQ